MTTSSVFRPLDRSLSPAGVAFADGMSAARRPTGPFVAILVVLAAFSVGHVVFALPLSLLLGPDGPDEASAAGQLFTNVVPFAGALLVVWSWIRWKERRPFATVGFASRRRPILLGALVGTGMIAVAVAAGVLTGQLAVAPGPFDSALFGALALGLVGFIVQSGTEEVLFRGFLLQAGVRRWGVVAAVLLQAALFALLHGVNPGGLAVLPLVNLFLFAVFLAVWALREGGLWVACAWHAMWNFSQGDLAGVRVSGEPAGASLLATTSTPSASDLVTGGAFGLEGGLLATAVLLVGVAVLVLLHHASARRAALAA